MSQSAMHDDRELTSPSLTVVLVGRTGNGKSATGNSILGRKAFKSRASSSSGVTTTCELQSAVLKDGQIINVIDTPGMFDFSYGSELMRKCINLAKDGIHAILVVFSVRTRFTQEEEAAIRSFENFFGSKISDYMIVVFTGGDELEANDETLEDYLGRGCPQPLKAILTSCHNRYVLFDNKTNDEIKKAKQLQQLLSLVNTLMLQNEGRPYTGDRSLELQVESRLKEATPKLEQNLAEEQAARLEAEKKEQKISNDIIPQLAAQVKEAKKETEKLRKQVAEENVLIKGQSAMSNNRELTYTPRTMVLVGGTGNGKSATGNSILGRRAFTSKPSSSGVTTKCQLERTVLKDGQILNVIDTPGLFDFSSGSELMKECLKLARDGIHAILVVFSVRTCFSQEEEAALRNLQNFFGSKIMDYMIVVFTGGDELEENDETLEDYLGQNCPQPLKEMLTSCQNRYVLFNNKTKDETQKAKQLQQLLSLVNTVMLQNDGRPYTGDTSLELQVESRLKEATSKLEQKLAEEQAARLEAEKKEQKISNDIIPQLAAQVKETKKEIDKLRKQLAEASENPRGHRFGCPIL